MITSWIIFTNLLIDMNFFLTKKGFQHVISDKEALW